MRSVWQGLPDRTRSRSSDPADQLIELVLAGVGSRCPGLPFSVPTGLGNPAEPCPAYRDRPLTHRQLRA